MLANMALAAVIMALCVRPMSNYTARRCPSCGDLLISVGCSWLSRPVNVFGTCLGIFDRDCSYSLIGKAQVSPGGGALDAEVLMVSARSVTPGGDDGIARVGRAVADRRLERGIASQRELAETAGVALNTAAQLERGHTFPRRSNARKLEKALQWPVGTLAAIRRGEPVPSAQPPQVPTVAPSPTTSNVHTGGIAAAAVNISGMAIDILLRHVADDPQAGTALGELDDHLLALETLIAASLPHTELFDETVTALADVHRHREALKAAARQAG
jgi:DNA-binding XRE family transcriptional regulator